MATTTPRPAIEALDVSAEQVAAEAVLLEARARSHSESDRIAYSLDLRLVTHPEAPVSTDDDYPGWLDQLAAMSNPAQAEGNAS